MLVPFMFVIAGILALFLVGFLLLGSGHRTNNLGELATQLQPIDVNAFRNLINENEEEFLRASLPWHEFRRIHGERMLAAVDYVRGTARNAGLLIRLAEAAKSDADPAVAEAAESLLQNATWVRLYAIQEIPRLYMSILVPSVNHTPHTLVERYDAMSRQGVTLNCLKPLPHAISAN